MDKTLNSLIGKKLVCIRPMTMKDKEREGWDDDDHSASSILVFDDGTEIYASQDDEGNGPGTLFGRDKQGTTFYV